MADEKEHTCIRRLTKTGYYKLEEYSKQYGDIGEDMMRHLRDIFDYDPNKSSVSLKTIENAKKKRDALKAEGISTYISSNMKKSYEKKKLQKQVDNAENTI